MSLTEENLEKKLQSATNRQDSIQTLSLWLLHHRAHHKKIVSAWLKVLKSAKIGHRLTLFYLANDVIQNSKRKGISLFKESFAEVLKEATLLVRDEQVRNSVNRVFKIWGERNIYDSDFISDLQSILENEKVPASAPSKLLASFKCEHVIEKLRSVSKLQTETTTKMATLNLSKLNATNAEIVQKLKDRMHGQQFSNEFDESSRCLEDVVKSLAKEVEERNELLLLLEQSEIYYDTQRGEAKIVANAYKNFGSRVKALQKKLEELMETFPAPSPVPSPCPDAPSPTTSDIEAELELPSEEVQNDLPKGEGSEEEQKPSTNNESDAFMSLTSPSLGKPIPILSSFLNQGTGQMSSWLDAFPKKNQLVSETSTSQSGSLDSRLSSLLQKIPNLPGSLQDTLQNATPVSDSTNKPAQPSMKLGCPFPISEGTPLTKDECSGQNTPLQDEDISASSNASSFFSRLAAAPKSSQSPKDILKGLTNLIQTASAKEKSFKPETWQSDKEPPIDKVSSFLNKLIPNKTSHTLSPPPFFNSPALSSESRRNDSPNSNPTSSSQTSVSSLPPQSSLTQPAVATNIHENLSFIPTLVPSTPTGSNFKFQEDGALEEYDPSSQNFDVDMDVESGEERSPSTPNSGDHSESASEKEVEEELIENLGTSRQSTLITLVTDSPKVDASKLEQCIASADENNLPITESYSSNQSVNQIDNWSSAPVTMTAPTEKVNENATLSSPSILPPPFFVSAGPPPLRAELISYPNGKEQAFHPPPPEHPHSKIETVQSSRIPNENKWFGNDWSDKDYRQGFPSRGRPNQRFQGYPAYRQKSYHPNFEGQRPPWGHSERPYMGHNFGPQQKRFPPPLRGRGWKRYPHPHPY